MLKTIKPFIKVTYSSFHILVLTIIGLVSSTSASAQGNLLITPKRIIFDGNQKFQEISLANIGKDTAQYAVSFMQLRMKEDGTFDQITEPDPGQNFSNQYLRIFPRTVTLAPREAQVVKVQVTRGNQLPQGEYRSHLYFRSVPKKDPLGESQTGPDTSGLAVRLVPIYGISIPVIIRVGASTTKVNLSDLKIEMKEHAAPLLQFRFNRTGNMSVYGDIIAEHISPQGKVTTAGIVKGIAVYTPNTIRNFTLRLSNKANIDYHTGKLRIVYTTQSDQSKLAEAELALH